MKPFNIPDEWTRFVSYSFNRIYISPASGCSANCAYCYIFEYGHPRKPDVFNVKGKQFRDWLVQQSGFRAGKFGTLISVAPSCDPFANGVTEKTLEIVRELAPLRNPIQLSTKYRVDSYAAKKLGIFQVLDGQILIYITITSFLHWRKLEPAADEPYSRLEGARSVNEHGLNTCLSVKPFLPGITEKEVGHFVEAIESYKIPFCAIGVMYVSNHINMKIKRRGLETQDFKEIAKNPSSIPPPPHSRDCKNSAFSINTVGRIKDFIRKLEIAGAQCVINGPCASALSYNTISPTGIWLYRPELCVECAVNCKEKFNKLHPVLESVYPINNPLPT